MEHDELVALRSQHAAWRLLRADNSPLVLAFCGRHFVEQNHGATAQTELVPLLDDLLYALNADPEVPRYPRAAGDYLDDWAADGTGWLRRFYPVGSDEVHYDATPALERAWSWVNGLAVRHFVGTESRLQTAVELLRQIVHGAETDPAARLAELHRRREAVEREIAEAEAGQVAPLDRSALRDRYQQFAGTARELLSDFRQVEENFRHLDRSARERIAAWSGGKGELLAELVGSRADITGSDQGRSFQAFYDFLLSESRRDELAELLRRVQGMPALGADQRLGTVHHDWSDAAERTQRTVRQISEQLRLFLDDQVWLENRRVLEIVRTVEAAALRCRDDPPAAGLVVDEPGIEIVLPVERPLHDERPATRVDSLLEPVTEADVDVARLLEQRHVDPAKLAARVRAVVPPRGSARLDDILGLHPVEQGAAEIVAYRALDEDDLVVSTNESGESVIDYLIEESSDPAGPARTARRVRLPQVTVSRR